MEIRDFKTSNDCLKEANSIEPNDLNVRQVIIYTFMPLLILQGFISLYKKWPEMFEKSLQISVNLLTDMIKQRTHEKDAPRFMKSAKDLFEITPKIKSENFRKIYTDVSPLTKITCKVSEFIHEQGIKPEILTLFIKHVDTMRSWGVIDQKLSSSMLWELLPQIKSDLIRDAIFYDMIHQLELMGDKKAIHSLIEKNKSIGSSLMCFTLFELKYNLFWDNLENHIQKIAKMLTDVTLKNVPYYVEIIYYAREFVDVSKTVNERFSTLLNLTSESIKSLAKIEVDIEIQIKEFEANNNWKEFTPLDSAKALVGSEGFTDEIVDKFLFLTKKQNSDGFFLVKRILLMRCLDEEVDEETILELAEQTRHWLTSSKSPFDLKFVSYFVFNL